MSQYVESIRAAASFIRYLTRSGFWRDLPFEARRSVAVHRSFFGINVASGPDPAIDDYLIERLRELNIDHVRMDLRSDGLNSYPERLYHRLTKEGFSIFLRLIQPPAEAAALDQDDTAQAAWVSFVSEVAERLDPKTVELGSTVNRKRWSGYSHASFLKAWALAEPILKTAGCTLAGPNVSDFEPTHAAALLAGLERGGILPDIHTNNLFVERVREPEAFDHRVMGQKMAARLKLNLVKKAEVFADLSEYFGIARTVCTHTCWNAVRVARWSDEVPQKQADYLVRYLVTAAAGGVLDQVYWGPLIGYPDGLIHDGSQVIPGLERVAFYERISGDGVATLAIQPAYRALKQTVEALSESMSHGGGLQPGGYFQYHFERGDGSQLLCCWARDGQRPPVDAALLEWLSRADKIRSCVGLEVEAPETIDEHPVFIYL